MIPTLVSTGKRPRQFTPVGSQYLDSLPFSPQAAFGVKRLISTATAAFRIRRSSDNAEQDIGFASGLDTIDTAAITAFVGANSAFVVRWIDQTGHGFDAVQATTTRQPRIVNAGVYDGRLVPDGTDDYLMIPSFVLGTPYFSAYHKLDIASFATYKGIFQTGTSYNTAGGVSSYTISSLIKLLSSNSTGANDYNGNQRPDTTGLRQRTALCDRGLANTAEIKLYSAGVDLGYTHDGNSANNTGNFVASADMYLMRVDGANHTGFKFETLVFYNTDSSAYRAAIEAITS